MKLGTQISPKQASAIAYLLLGCVWVILGLEERMLGTLGFKVGVRQFPEQVEKF